MSDNFSGSQTFWACCKNGRAINKVIFQQKNFLKKFHVLLDWVLVLTSSASICFFNLPCICTQFLRPIFTVNPFGFRFLKKYICIRLQIYFHFLIYKDICLPVSFATCFFSLGVHNLILCLCLLLQSSSLYQLQHPK